MQPEDFSYEDFLAYSLIYAAYADSDMMDEERDVIIAKVNSDEYDKMMAVFQAHNDMERINTFTALVSRFCTDDATKEKLYADMNQVFMADNHLDIEETNFLRLIKHLIG